MSSEVNTVNSFNLFRDIDWLRRVVGSCTGSPSAYLLLPSFCLALAAPRFPWLALRLILALVLDTPSHTI